MFGFNEKHLEKKTALILGGGGARAAYQVGVLKAIAEIVPEGQDNPFQIISGTSAGSINAAALASNAANFHGGVDKIVRVWSNFKLASVFYVDARRLFSRIRSWLWVNIGWGSENKQASSLLDNSPLRRLLSHYIHPERIDKSIEQGHLHGFCVTACSYTTGQSTSFFHGHESIQDWERTHREGRREQVTVEHLMASSAIPLVFPAIKLGEEYFGDGSMRQTSPLSPALHLGADKLLIIGLRVEEKRQPLKKKIAQPSLSQTAGYILDTVFLNSLMSDIENLDMINSNLQKADMTQSGQLKQIDYLMISPSVDIADVAKQYYSQLPVVFRKALAFLGMRQANSRRFISYLMFLDSFCKQLIDIGYQDAMGQKAQIEAFLQG